MTGLMTSLEESRVESRELEVEGRRGFGAHTRGAYIKDDVRAAPGFGFFTFFAYFAPLRETVICGFGAFARE